MGEITRRSRRSLRKRLARAKLGRWSGWGKDRKFVPLSKQEREELLLMVRHNQFQDIEEDDDGIVVEDGYVQPAQQNKKWFGGWKWHTPIYSRPGLLEESWHKGIKVKFRAKAYAKMVYYCQAVDTEISGFGKTLAIKDADGKILSIEVTDVMLFKQECTGAFTDLSQESMSNFLYELAKANEDPSQWNHWWHTHNNFGVFWSGTDDSTVSRIIKAFNPTFLLSTCINKKCDLIARIDSLNVKGEELSSNNDVSIVPIRNDQWKSKCLNQVKKLVSKKVYTYEPVTYHGWGHSRGWGHSSFYSHSDMYGQDNLRKPEAQRQLPALQHALGLSNADRRARGWMQDPDLPDYQPLLSRMESAHQETMPFFID